LVGGILIVNTLAYVIAMSGNAYCRHELVQFLHDLVGRDVFAWHSSDSDVRLFGSRAVAFDIDHHMLEWLEIEHLLEGVCPLGRQYGLGMAGGDDGQVSPKRCLDFFIKMVSTMVSLMHSSLEGVFPPVIVR
jgi:hypothetical protein